MRTTRFNRRLRRSEKQLATAVWEPGNRMTQPAFDSARECGKRIETVGDSRREAPDRLRTLFGA